MLENYNLNHQGQSSEDHFSNWIYENTGTEAPESNIDEAWSQVAARAGAPVISVKRNSNRIFYKVAAAIALLAVSAYLIIGMTSDPALTEVVASDSMKTITLSDGSKVILNTNSSISFPEKFTDSRAIELVGEAYFDVVSDDRSFIISAGTSEVEVLGTSFNVLTIGERTEVFVEEGSVRFSNNADHIQLRAGEFAYTGKTDDEITKALAPDNISSWRDGKFKFVETPLNEVTAQLGKYYGVKFELSPAITTCRVTATFNNESLSRVVAVLEAVLNAQSTKKGKTISLKAEGCQIRF